MIGLLRSNNLSDLDNVAQARTNLGLQQKTLDILADLETAGLEAYRFTALLNVTGPLQTQINTLAADLATADSALTAFIDLDATLANLTAETLIATYEDSTGTGIGSSTDTFWDADSAGGIETASGITDVDVQGSLTCDSLGWGATPIATVPVQENYLYGLPIGGLVIPLTGLKIFTVGLNIGGVDVINSSEAQNGFYVWGIGLKGSTVTLAFSSGHTLAGGNNTGVDANGIWRLWTTESDVTAFGEGPESVTATQTDVEGNVTAVATRTFVVDTTAPLTLTVDAITGDDAITQPEARAGFSITGTGTAGYFISVQFPDSNHVLTGFQGNNAVVAPDGTWSVEVNESDILAFGPGWETVTVTQKDPVGNASQPVIRDFIPAMPPPGPPTIDAVTGNDVVTQTEAQTGFSITGTGSNANTITLTFPDSNHILIGGNSTVVEPDGTWSIAVAESDVLALGQGSVTVAATQTNIFGQSNGTGTQKRTFTIQ